MKKSNLNPRVIEGLVQVIIMANVGILRAIGTTKYQQLYEQMAKEEPALSKKVIGTFYATHKADGAFDRAYKGEDALQAVYRPVPPPDAAAETPPGILESHLSAGIQQLDAARDAGLLQFPYGAKSDVLIDRWRRVSSARITINADNNLICIVFQASAKSAAVVAQMGMKRTAQFRAAWNKKQAFIHHTRDGREFTLRFPGDTGGPVHPVFPTGMVARLGYWDPNLGIEILVFLKAHGAKQVDTFLKSHKATTKKDAA